jgi:hypothetical protein
LSPFETISDQAKRFGAKVLDMFGSAGELIRCSSKRESRRVDGNKSRD